ncbi:hypothetical protein Tco_0916114 [Tanacetum coccineum]
MLWEWRGIANMDFIQLGGSSRVGEMILARERSGFAGEKLYHALVLVSPTLSPWVLLFNSACAVRQSNLQHQLMELSLAVLYCCVAATLTVFISAALTN